MFFFLAVFGLLSCLMLGGGTKAGFLSDALLQFLSIPVFLVALWRVLDAPFARERRLALAFCVTILAIPLIQLLPLPPVIWTHLPGRELVVQTFDLLGHPAAWAPISVAPEATWLAFLSLLPPLAIFLAVLTLDWRERRLMSFALIAFGVVSVFLGLLQLAQGPTSPLRFFEFTNQGDPVGFFANRNHFAALLYCSILLCGAMLAPQFAALSSGRKKGRLSGDASYPLAAIAVGVALIVLIAGEVVSRSRAGVILMIVALVAGFVLYGDHRRAVENVTFPRLLGAIVALAIVLLGQAALSRLLDRFDVDPLADARFVFARSTIAAAKSVMPIGAGVGSFPSIYPTFEKSGDLLPGIYANHAHNDFLEAWLETGLIGPILFVIFLIWLARKAIAAWASSNPDLLPVDRALIRASILIILLLLGHSFVDYPLRTGAMMAVFALACGLLIDPPIASAAAAPLSNRNRQRLRRRTMAASKLSQ